MLPLLYFTYRAQKDTEAKLDKLKKQMSPEGRSHLTNDEAVEFVQFGSQFNDKDSSLFMEMMKIAWGSKTMHDDRFNTDNTYSLYFWKLRETNQIYFVELQGENPKGLYEGTEMSKEQRDYLSHHYTTSVEQIEAHIPGALAHKEYMYALRFVRNEGNIPLNYGCHLSEFINVKTKKVVPSDRAFKYFETPSFENTLPVFDYYYKKTDDIDKDLWDVPDKKILQHTCIYGWLPTKSLYTKLKDRKYKHYTHNMHLAENTAREIISELGGHVYKHPGVRSRSIIVPTFISADDRKYFRNRGLKIYHIFDIIKQFGDWDSYRSQCLN